MLLFQRQTELRDFNLSKKCKIWNFESNLFQVPVEQEHLYFGMTFALNFLLLFKIQKRNYK